MLAWMMIASVGASMCGVEPEGVNGRVMFDGKPAAGALVSISTQVVITPTGWASVERHRDMGLWALTDEHGRFTLDTSGTAHMLKGFCFGKDGGVASIQLPGTGAMASDIVLERREVEDTSRTCRVRVLDDEGAPLAGALVMPTSMVLSFGGTWGGELPAAAQRTDADGNATVAYVTQEGYAKMEVVGLGMRVVAEGFAWKELPRVVFGGPVNEVRMGKGCRVVGRLVDRGEPVAGAWVDLTQAMQSGDLTMTRQRARTDAAGQFAFDHIPADTEVWISAPAWANSAGVVGGPIKLTTLKDAEVLDAGRINAAKGRRVAGRVVATQGATLKKNAWMTLGHEHGWLGWSTPIGEEGRFEFKDVPDGGLYVMTVCSEGVMMSPANAAAAPGWYMALRGMVTRDHTDLEVEVVPYSQERTITQPLDLPMRGVEAERAQ